VNRGYIVNTVGAVALAAATRKTLVSLIAGAAAGVQIRELMVAFDGVTASGVPVLVELNASSQAGAGTPGTSPTPTQYKGKVLACPFTAAESYSAEPTASGDACPTSTSWSP
jgi:hypothetical protein